MTVNELAQLLSDDVCRSGCFIPQRLRYTLGYTNNATRY